jgi:hypothetical protein
LTQLALALKVPGDRRHGPSAIAFSPCGRRLATAHANGDLHVWAWPTGEHVASVRGRWGSPHAANVLDERRVTIIRRDIEQSRPVGVWTRP